MDIYVLRGREQQGPFTLDEIYTRLAAGHLSLSDLALPQGAAQWLPLSEIAGASPASMPPPSGEQKRPAATASPRLQQRLELDAAMRAHEQIEARKDRNEHARNWCITAVVASIALLGTALVLGNQEGHGLATGLCLTATVATGFAAVLFYGKIEAMHAPFAGLPATGRARTSAAPWTMNPRIWIAAILLCAGLGYTIYKHSQVSRANYNAVYTGMTKAEVRAVLGNPDDVTEVTLEGERMDQWVYTASSFAGSRVILIDFENGRVWTKSWGGGHY